MRLKFVCSFLIFYLLNDYSNYKNFYLCLNKTKKKCVISIKIRNYFLLLYLKKNKFNMTLIRIEYKIIDQKI